MPKQIAVVTGFAGFIGKTFTEKLLSKGWKVYGIDKFTYVCERRITEYENFTYS